MKPIIYILSFILFLTPSCTKDFEETNRNPFSPTAAEDGAIFNNVVSSLRLGWNEQFYLHNETLYGVTQLGALTSATFQNISIGTEDRWSNFYLALAHIRELEHRFDEMEVEPEALNNVQGMTKILLAYKTFRLTDLFGDIPFFDAGRGFEDLDFSRPKFDSQEEVYKFLLDELKWAVENINTFADPVTASGEQYVSFGNFDNLFNGDMESWVKFANSLRLRHALRIVEKDPGFALPIIKEILENNLPLIEKGEDVIMLPSAQNWRNEGVNWSFREHNKLRMGSNIWRLLSEHDSLDGSGIFDPRAYVFYETNNADEWVPFPQVPDAGTSPSGGIPYQLHRDGSYSVKGQSNVYSPFNYYLIRDNTDIPEIIMTAAEIHFLKAEAHLRGLGVATNQALAENEYTEGTAASIFFWQSVMTNSNIWENQPEMIYTENELIGLASGDPHFSIFLNDNKLEMIYAQRWLDAFRQPWEAYALARRTQMTPREGGPIEHFRFPYPPSEVENNPDNWAEQVSKMVEDSERVKVWWME